MPAFTQHIWEVGVLQSRALVLGQSCASGRGEVLYQTGPGVRAESLAPLGIMGPLSFKSPSSTCPWVPGIRLGWLGASSSFTFLNSGQKSPQRVLHAPSSLAR